MKTAKRIREAMEKNGWKQVDVITKAHNWNEQHGTNIKLTKSLLSMYLSGKCEPRADKLFLLSNVLGVPEVWLAGYDDCVYQSSQDSLDHEIQNLRCYLKNMTDTQKKLLLHIARAILEEDAL